MFSGAAPKMKQKKWRPSMEKESKHRIETDKPKMPQTITGRPYMIHTIQFRVEQKLVVSI